MKGIKEDKFPIVVTEAGLHICIDDILTPREGYDLIQAVQNALFEYKILTGKHVDEGGAR